MNLKLNKLQHVGIPVTNLERSIEFYQKLGFQDVMHSTFVHNGEEGRVAMMELNGIIMELYQMPEAEMQEIKSRSNGHIDHVAFDVDDIDQAYEVIKNKGFETLEDQPVFLNFWNKGCKYFYILGPDRERLEFCQIIK